MIVDIIGRLVDRIMNMSNARTFDRTTDSLEAISNAVAALIAALAQEMRPEIQLFEGWQDELGIDFTLWTLLNPATAWARGAGAGVAAPHLVATNTMILNELSRLVGNQRWPIAPDTWAANTILRRVVFEFEMTIATLASLDNTACFFGLTPAQAATRITQDIIGFALIGAGNDLQTVTDAATVETVNTGFAENLALYNKFRIDILTPLIAGVPTPSVRFYLNEALLATHVTNLPDLPMYPNFYFDTAAGGSISQIGIIRIWTEDYQRV